MWYIIYNETAEQEDTVIWFPSWVNWKRPEEETGKEECIERRENSANLSVQFIHMQYLRCMHIQFV